MSESGKQIEEKVDQLQDVFENGRRKLGEVAKTASAKSKQAASLTDDWVRQNPWVALGIVAAVGLVIGLLVSQSRED